MEAILTILVVGALNVACFFIGAKIGQTVAKGERIEAPNVNPLKAIREREARKEAEAERDKVATIMRNIDSYDGTGAHQEDVPRN